MQILIIQTAFIGDVVLATGLIESLRKKFKDAEIDFLLRKGNELLLEGHPHLRNILIWQKKKSKYRNLFKLLGEIRSTRYDLVINLQRFAATGILTAFSGAGERIGFNRNPLARFFDRSIPHIREGLHEFERNHQLIKHLVGEEAEKPRLYPRPEDLNSVAALQHAPYICVAPGAVWFTKRLPLEKWVAFIDRIPQSVNVFLIGGPEDYERCEFVLRESRHPSIQILAGKLTFLASAALMEKALMNYVHDSAPMHFASAMNAPVTAVYCSTVPSFGFGPLSEVSNIVERSEPLYCRPCGLHGRKSCPEKHFRCAMDIEVNQISSTLSGSTA